MVAPAVATPKQLRHRLAVVRRMIALHKGPFAIGVAGASLYALATVTSAFVLGRVTDRVIVPRFGSGDVSSGTVGLAVAAITGVGLVKATGIVVRRVGATIAVANIAATMRRRLVEHYQLVPLEYHRRRPSGELVAHVGADVDTATDVLSPVPYAIGVSVIVLTALAWLIATDVYLALVALVLFPTIVGLNLVYQRKVEEPAGRTQAALGTISAVAHESFDGALVVKALGAEAHESARFERAAAELRDAKVRVAVLRARFETTLDAMPSLAIVVLLLVGAARVDRGAITTGQVVGFVSLFLLMVWPLRLIGYVLGDLPPAVAGYDRVEAVLAEPLDPRHELSGGHRATARAGDVEADEAAQVRGARLDLREVSFGYEPGLCVLDDIDLHIEPGATVALVGPTGSGKSTLLYAVAGLLTPHLGRISLDGRDLAELTVAELSAEVAIAFQEPFLFGDTVAENILLGVGGPADLDNAARLAGAERFVHGLPDQFDTVVGERGATLSGGQRQRVALARALARRPRLLLLDDATSSVDPVTEAGILSALSERLGTTTVLMVASRLSTIAVADRVVFLEDGHIVASGPHEQLMREQPAYHDLVRAYELEREVPAGNDAGTRTAGDGDVGADRRHDHGDAARQGGQHDGAG